MARSLFEVTTGAYVIYAGEPEQRHQDLAWILYNLNRGDGLPRVTWGWRDPWIQHEDGGSMTPEEIAEFKSASRETLLVALANTVGTNIMYDADYYDGRIPNVQNAETEYIKITTPMTDPQFFASWATMMTRMRSVYRSPVST